jgi:hypothetical protein
MPRRSRSLAAAALVLAGAASAADFVTQRWRGAAQGPVVVFDLSGLKTGTKVYRAVFIPALDRRDDYSRRIEFCPVLPDGKVGEPLKLRPPLYQSFDATEIVRAWAAVPKSNLGLSVRSAPRLKPDSSVLEISYEGTAADPLPNVSELKAVSQYGQTFRLS